MKKIQAYIYILVILVALLGLAAWADRQVESTDNLQTRRYVNKSLRVDFQYPEEWGVLEVDNNVTDKQTAHFTATNERIADIFLHIPSKTIVFIERNDLISSLSEGIAGRGNELHRLFKDGTTEEIYTIPQKYVEFGNWGVFSWVYFSPSGRFVHADVATSIETSVIKIFDLETGADLFGKDCLNAEIKKIIPCPVNSGPHGISAKNLTLEELIDGVYWSKDEQVLVLSSYPNYIGGAGLDGLFISDYGSPEKMNVAFTREKSSPPLPPELPNALRPLNITDITIDEEGVVDFKTTVDDGFGEEAEAIERREFNYNAKTKKLDQVSYTPHVN